jgi:hypothetical protein
MWMRSWDLQNDTKFRPCIPVVHMRCAAA